MNAGLTMPTERPALLEPGPARRWLRILAVNTAGALGVTLLLTIVGAPWPFSASLVASLIYANCIGTPAALLLPPLARRFTGRPLLWPALLGALLALAVAGSLLAGLVLIAVGLVPAAQFWAAWAFGVRLAVVIVLGIGVSLFFYERTRARLAATTAELRARELAQARAEQLAAEARLAALEARLHPHFLFNALNAIQALIPEDPARAERLVGRLGGLLRYSLDRHPRSLVPLGQELTFIRGYLEIQAARFEARLRYRIEVPREIEAALIPALALHTLVENSVTHVAEARPEGAEIRVEGRREDDRLWLRVWDDGPGFRLEEIPPTHGLDTLRARLDALYGDEAGLQVSRDEAGASVALSLPAGSGEVGP